MSPRQGVGPGLEKRFQRVRVTGMHAMVLADGIELPQELMNIDLEDDASEFSGTDSDTDAVHEDIGGDTDSQATLNIDSDEDLDYGDDVSDDDADANTDTDAYVVANDGVEVRNWPIIKYRVFLELFIIYIMISYLYIRESRTGFEFLDRYGEQQAVKIDFDAVFNLSQPGYFLTMLAEDDRD